MDNPEYQVVFRIVAVRESVDDIFEFENPPPRQMLFAVAFMDVEDAKRLADRHALIHVDVRSKDGSQVMSTEIAVYEESFLSERPSAAVLATWIRPPIGWCDGPKGQVVNHRDIVWRGSGEDLDDKWVVGPGDGHGIVQGRAEFRSGSYLMRIRVEVATPLDEPVSFYPVLAGGFPGNL